MFIIKHKNFFIGFSILLVIASIISLFIFKLNFGIDFRGGSITEVLYSADRPDVVVLQEALRASDIEALLQPTEETGLIIKTRSLSEPEHQELLATLSKASSGKLAEISFNSIGPSVGKELKHKSIVSIILVSLGIVFFITYAFRKVSKPIQSWKYGLIAIATLLHDVLIPTGIFAIVAHYQGIEVDTLIIVAVLTILGLSVSDTIVVFDRIRENLNLSKEHKDNESFEHIVGTSIRQTFTRSISTSLTVILVLLALVFFGPSSTRYFAIMLTAGMFFGTYSSIFLASPLLVTWENYSRKRRERIGKN
ncbi:protein translocase subunit SecF [Candidatus Nomurabacteria bacterium]|jgi:preprotein translocase subunit SecF|nr:MAG: protein translocase subunit SecF [Candidatus Nomurabacteria bacterium]